MSLHFFLNWILLTLLTGPTVSELLVTGEVGQNITMPCSYTVNEESGTTSMCWGRGSCPSSKCSQPIVWTDGWKVTYRYHSRYVLRGKLHEGNVSLTIINAKEADSGTYCCRVEIPGWFNDKLTNLQVVIKKGYLHNMKKMSNFASSVAFWKPKRAENQSALEVEIHAEENIYTIH
ncbi:Hepatitis A virus cellular receptor 2 isoform X5 [Aix galericulata]|nr:Hepatitis A virus cellular receptor 2 isoform X5 [Aix galericulata]